MRVLMAMAVAAMLAAAGPSAVSARAVPHVLPQKYRVVESSAVTVTAGTQRHSVVFCPAGTVVLDGGARISATLGDVFLNGSYPEAMTAWGVDVNNANLVDATFAVWAVCAKQNSTYSIVQSPFQLDNPPNNQTLVTTSCPSGTKVLGGGAASDSSATSVNLNESYPHRALVGTHLQYSWSASMNNGSPIDDFVSSFAICGVYVGYQMIQGTAVTNPAGQNTAASVTCPGAKVPLGGGLSSNSPNVHVNLVQSFPSGTSWTNTEGNGSGGAHKVTPFAICGGT
jgi:hypothetical protein